MGTPLIWRLIGNEFVQLAMESEDQMHQQYRPVRLAREGE